MADDSEQSRTQRKRKQEVREFNRRQNGTQNKCDNWAWPVNFLLHVTGGQSRHLVVSVATNMASRYWRLSYGITKVLIPTMHSSFHTRTEQWSDVLHGVGPFELRPSLFTHAR